MNALQCLTGKVDNNNTDNNESKLNKNLNTRNPSTVRIIKDLIRSHYIAICPRL